MRSRSLVAGKTPLPAAAATARRRHERAFAVATAAGTVRAARHRAQCSGYPQASRLSSRGLRDT